MGRTRIPNADQAITKPRNPEGDTGGAYAGELLLEFQAQQIDMAMQNGDSGSAYADLLEALDHYVDLYNYAPVAYLTLSENELIIEANLTCAALLGVKHKELINSRFRSHVASEDVRSWYRFFRRAKLLGGKQNHELTLRRADGNHFYARIDCVSSEKDDEPMMLRIAIVDITERKQAEEALRKREQLLDFALLQSRTGVWDIDLVDHAANRTLEPARIFGYESDPPPWTVEMFLEHLLPEDRFKVDRIIKEAILAQSGCEFDCRIRRTDSEVRWIRVITENQQDNNFQMRQTGIVQDITEHKQAEEAFKKSHYQLESFIKLAPLSIAMFDHNMNYLAISDKWLVEFGRDYKNVIGRNHYEMHPDLPAKWKIVHQQGLAGAYLNNDDDLWIKEDGSEYWLSWTVSPWFDQKGSIGGIIISTENITERKQTEQRLRIAAIAFESQNGIVITDANATILQVNRSFTDITGYSADDVIGRNTRMLGSGRHDKAFYTAMWKRIHAVGTWEGEIVNKHKNGEAYIEWLTITAVKNEQGEITNYVASMNDITERKNAKEKAKEHLEKLAHVTRLGLMGEMAAGIAHEVNQPLTSISTYTQVSLNIINTEIPDLVKLNEILIKTQQQAVRVGRIIHHMKEFGKSHSQQHLAKDINTLIYDATNLCMTELKHNNIQLNFELANNLPPVVVDHIQIEQVIINLIRNSVEALQDLPPNLYRQLTIRSGITSNHHIQVSVKDNGLGIDEEQKQKILTPFHTTKINGTGMGLSISRSLIEAHKGTLYFNSQPGKGCTFYFTLPIDKSERR
ncbi:MAG: PAS domain S-box protein [Methylobacter sp.]